MGRSKRIVKRSRFALSANGVRHCDNRCGITTKLDASFAESDGGIKFTGREGLGVLIRENNHGISREVITVLNGEKTTSGRKRYGVRELSGTVVPTKNDTPGVGRGQLPTREGCVDLRKPLARQEVGHSPYGAG